ncbi:transglutaminase domain-containing protein, partial [Aduncisulcus paluster]
NTLDVPHNEFLDAAESMDQVRLDKAPDKYGIDEYTGQKYLNYKLFSDAAHLAKLEITPWESWGFGERAALDKLTEPDVKVLHTLEEVIKNEILPDIQKLFTDNRDFIVPDMYKPFYLELPFFKAE